MSGTPHNYFLVSPENVHEDHFLITGDEYHHAKNVLRAGTGSSIFAVDGAGTQYTGTFTKINPDNSASFSILDKKIKPNEPIIDVTLIQAIIKGDRFDHIVEKAVELGVNRIIPFESDRTIVKTSENKTKRWKRIALSAMKQCGRSILPEITESKTLQEALSVENIDRKFLCSGSARQSISELLGDCSADKGLSFVLVIGPEGDFTNEEVLAAREKGYSTVNLGNRRLRSDTAAIASLSILMSFYF